MKRPRSSIVDLLVLAGHGTGQAAFGDYCRAFKNTRFITPGHLLGQAEELTALIDKDCSAGYLGLIIDRWSEGWSLEDFLKLLRSRRQAAAADEPAQASFDLVLLSRDPVEQLLSLANTRLLWWAFKVSGFNNSDALASDFYETSSSMADFLNKLVQPGFFYDTQFSVVKLLPLLAPLSRQTIVLDIDDIRPGRDEETMTRLGQKLFNDPSAWAGRSPGSNTRGLTNRFFSCIEPLRLNFDARLFTFSPRPEKWFNLGQAPGVFYFAYDPEEIEWEGGEFSGRLALVSGQADLLRFNAALSEALKKMLDDGDKKILRRYSRAINGKYKKALAVFDSVKLLPETLLEHLLKNYKLYQAVSQIILEQRQALEQAGSTNAKTWKMAEAVRGTDYTGRH